MAENKSSFILYSDIINQIELLTNEEAGIIFKTILEYVNDRNPVLEDRFLSLCFAPIKAALKRDLNKWENKKVNLSDNGRKGGIISGEVRRSKSKQIEANASISKQIEANRSKTKQSEANEPVIVNVIANVNDSVNVIDKNNIDSRKMNFATSLDEYRSKYSVEMMTEFESYWTELNKSKTKMRFEGEKYFDVSRRLATWANKSYNKKDNKPQKEKPAWEFSDDDTHEERQAKILLMFESAPEPPPLYTI